MSTGPTINRHKSKQDWATPPEFIEAVEKRFGKIEFDLAASAENTKHTGFYDEERDSLKQDWHKLYGNLWLNPPFSNIAPWAKKCAEEASLGATILFLTPASIGSNWFRDYVHRKAQVLALNGRITFIGAITPYPKDCILSTYGFPIGFDVWNWR